jgi:hypothetical protein
MTSHVFDCETGRLQDDVPSIYIEAIRQICLVYKKVELQCTPARERAALDNFISVEHDVQQFSASPEDSALFAEISDILWTNAVGSFDPSVLVPSHGPGATAERISGNQKYVWRAWFERLDRCFPFYDYAYSLSHYDETQLQEITFVPENMETPSRISLVPKTLTSPRIIAIEPVCMQYAQQALRAYLYDTLESYWLTRGRINFRDQSINQRLARDASADGRFATIDLSDASDRVPWSMVQVMLQSTPLIREYIDACRSRSTCLPDGTIVPLAKFASMGSALCFPIEAMYFYTICVVASLQAELLPVSPENVYLVSRDIYVYGDDIVVPTHRVVAVLDYLQKYNCKVSAHKSFWTGRFRESCGVDAYNGDEVTPIYVRRMLPENRQQVQEIISLVATANQFYLKGYWRTAQLLFDKAESIIGPLPYVGRTSSVLGRISYLGYRSVSRWNVDHQSFELKGWHPSTIHRSDSVDGYPALQKCLLGLESSPDGLVSTDIDHLEMSAWRGAITLKRRWAPTYVT